MHSLPQLILASNSPRRVKLLRELNLAFEVVASEADELQHDQLTAMELCQVNAYRKARWVAKRHPDSLVLGADTLVCLRNQVMGKPKDLEAALTMLQQLQGTTHQVATGVCLLRLRSHRQRVFAVSTMVTFRPLTREQIQQYLAKIDPLDKAGAYAIQENGEMLVDCLIGSYSNVVGLPIEQLRTELNAWIKSSPDLTGQGSSDPA